MKEEQMLFSFKSLKSCQEIKPTSNNNQTNNINNSNNNIRLSINITKSNEKSPAKDRNLISNSAKKKIIRNSFFATGMNLDDSCLEQTVIKSRLPTRENRNSVLFDIMRSAIIDKNSNRKYLATAKENGKRGDKNKFEIYDSSDDSDSNICILIIFFLLIINSIQ